MHKRKSSLSHIIYEIPPGTSAGRAITTMLRDIPRRVRTDKIVVLGSQDAKISGKPEVIIEKYKKRARRNPLWRSGPLYPKTPERFLKRMIRGMLNYKSTQKEVYRKLVVDPRMKEGVIGLKGLNKSQEVERINLAQLCKNDLRINRGILIKDLVEKL